VRYNKILVCVGTDSTKPVDPANCVDKEVVLPAPADGTPRDLKAKIGSLLAGADGVIPPFIIKDISLGVGEGVSLDVEVIHPHRI